MLLLFAAVLLAIGGIAAVADHDTNGDREIDKIEVIAALNLYLFEDALTKAEVIDIITHYLFDIELEPPAAEGTWRGITVAPENRCAPYDADDYPYSQSVEQLIVGDMGGIIYGPYTGTWFASTSETDIEHIVARSEAHDSGLCAADAATRRRFASDILNLTLASPSVNRSQKSGKDAAEWLPDLNRCWFASRVVEVRLKYALTVDERERDAIEGILSGCSSTAMIVDTSGQAATATPVPAAVTATPVPAAGVEGGALELYDDNGNGRITCAEARRHGIAPVSRGHPAYPYMDDRDGDGVVCE